MNVLRVIARMAMEFTLLSMDQNMKVIGRMEADMDRGYTTFLMADCMWVSSRMVQRTGKERLPIQVA